jgi:hypothetical protein
MLGLTSLPAHYRGIVDLTGLEYAVNLISLSLSGNQITDINAVSELTNLTSLYLGGNQISDINAVSSLTNLTSLWLYDNHITDINALSDLTNLETLWLGTNPLFQSAYCVYIPIIKKNNSGIYLTYDPNPNPMDGDCYEDCFVDFFDFALLAGQWMEMACGDCEGVDLNYDANVDSNDLKIIVDNWLKQTALFIEINCNHNPGWTTEGQWQFGQPSGVGGFLNGNPDPDSGYTGKNVYGVNLVGDHTVAVGGSYCLIAGPFDFTDYIDMRLKFARWLNTDEPSSVTCKVEVSNNGSTWQTAWENETAITDNSWQIVEYDVSETADNEPTVYFRWNYEILDSVADPYSGWNIDDVEILGNL